MSMLMRCEVSSISYLLYCYHLFPGPFYNCYYFLKEEMQLFTHHGNQGRELSVLLVIFVIYY